MQNKENTTFLVVFSLFSGYAAAMTDGVTFDIDYLIKRFNA